MDVEVSSAKPLRSDGSSSGCEALGHGRRRSRPNPEGPVCLGGLHDAFPPRQLVGTSALLGVPSREPKNSAIIRCVSVGFRATPFNTVGVSLIRDPALRSAVYSPNTSSTRGGGVPRRPSAGRATARLGSASVRCDYHRTRIHCRESSGRRSETRCAPLRPICSIVTSLNRALNI